MEPAVRALPCGMGQEREKATRPALGDQACPLPVCRARVPGSVGFRAGFPGSPKVGIGEGVTFSCLMEEMSRASY